MKDEIEKYTTEEIEEMDTSEFRHVIDWERRKLPDDFDFNKMALQKLGLTEHPKAGKLCWIAYDMGHSAGYGEVFSYMVQMAELLQ